MIFAVPTRRDGDRRRIWCRLHVRHALREINFGQWEGITWNEIERRDNAYARRWIENYPSLPAPGGESFHEFERRVLDEVRDLSFKAETADCAIAVVTHAGVLRTVLCALQGCSEEIAREQTTSYCSVVRHTTAVCGLVQTAEAGV